MKTTTIICSMLAMLAMGTFASGLYIISGGDLRPCYIKYILQTTEADTQMTITPKKVSALSQWYSDYRKFPWSIKCDGTEFKYTPYDCVGLGSGAEGETLTGGCSNAAPATMVLKNPGNHVVKIYNIGDNIHMFVLESPYVVAASVDWENISTASKSPTWSAQNCANLEYIYYANPIGTTGKIAGFNNLPKLKHLEFKHPEKFTKVDAYQFMNDTALTNSFMFANVTEVGTMSFRYANNVPYMGIPRVQKIGASAFGKSTGPGLHTLMIGDSLTQFDDGAFHGQSNLDTIEFFTEAVDWVAAWNNHALLPNLFGTATATEVEGEATLTPLETKPSTWSAYTDYPRPTHLKLNRP